MKKTSKAELAATLRKEYQFDYGKSEPNRFAVPAASQRVAVVLDPDVAKVFRDGVEVNTALRALMSAMPQKRRAG